MQHVLKINLNMILHLILNKKYDIIYKVSKINNKMILTRLKIQNVGLVEAADINFISGMIVLTGETGAGKSMILNALNMIMGERTEMTLLRKNAEQAVVEAVFAWNNGAEEIQLKNFLKENNFDVDEELFIRRELNHSGKSFAYVMGRIVPIKILQKITESFINIYSQHANQSLLQKSTHRNIIDEYAGAANLAEEVFADYNIWKKSHIELLDWENKERELRRQEDLLRFQLEEINSANLIADEETELLNREKQLVCADEIMKNIEEITSVFNAEEIGIFNGLRLIAKNMKVLKQLLPKTEEWIKQLTEALEILKDLSHELENINIENDAVELDKIQNRLAMIDKLKKKYGENISVILKYKEKIADELETTSSYDKKLLELQAIVQENREKLVKKAEKLSELRKKAAKKIIPEIMKELNALGMGAMRCEYILEKLPELQSCGFESAELFIGNPGQDLMPLAKIASGGELSRVLLAICCVRSDSEKNIMIFDEIDAGISATVAKAVGDRLHKLSKNHQIFVITHMPGIAAMAEQHIMVEKHSTTKSTEVKTKLLDEKARVLEIARMLGGYGETEQIHAKKLLNKE